MKLSLNSLPQMSILNRSTVKDEDESVIFFLECTLVRSRNVFLVFEHAEIDRPFIQIRDQPVGH